MMGATKLEALEKALAQERAARKNAEKIAEEKSNKLFTITQELEQTLQYQETELKDVYSHIIDAYIEIDLEGTITKMNDATKDLIGIRSSKEKVNAFSIIHREHAAYAFEALDSLLENGYYYNYKSKIFTKKGEVKWVHINASLIYNNEKKPVGARGVIRDISDQINMEEIRLKLIDKLKSQKRKYRSIIANMNLGLLEFDNDGKVLLMNQSFKDISGYEEADLIGKIGKDILVHDDYKDIIDREANNRLKGISNSYEIVAKTKDGKLKNWLISGAPNYDQDGNVKGSIGVHLDITEVKELEKQKQKLLEKLEKSNEELQQYAHIVSHDLKSPLRNIHTVVDWIIEDNIENFSVETLGQLNLIKSSIEKMDQLIKDVLNYSSINSDLTNEAVAIDTIIKEVAYLMHIPDHIKIETNKLPVIFVDKTRIQQVFQNLIYNAVKYNDKKSGTIKVIYKELDDYHQFSVSDNGPGIEKKYYEKIFKIFQSIHKSDDSSGIGLSIVKKIVNLYNGEIWLESVVKKGTTFYFTLKK